MTWLIWRQHRAQVAIVAALLIAFAVPVWITGQDLSDRLISCRAGTTCGGILQGYESINTVVDLTVMVPLLLGVFLCAAVAGRELETGTAALVWTQSITRRRWVNAKFATLFAITIGCAAVDTALVTWWSNTHNAVVESRLAGLQFDIQGVVPIAYTGFAAALGVAAGALWRRALPAMATTVGAFIGVRLVVELYARPHFMAPIVKTIRLSVDDPVPSGAQSISTTMVHNGHAVSGPIEVPRGCAGLISRSAMNDCMDRSGYAVRVTYQPADRYWQLQWIEFGIFAAAAVALTIVGVAVLLRRDA